MTGRELVTASLRLIGAIAPGETLEAQEATDGLSALNRMLGSWSTENLLAFKTVREEFTLTTSDGIYSMGASGDFNTTRPIKIEKAMIEVQDVTPTAEYPVRIVTSLEWAAIESKDITSEIPYLLYAEGTYPTETINLYPVPTTAHKLVLYSTKALTEVATLDTALTFPPGYDRALIFNLAIDLAPEYGATVSEVVGMTAMESKAGLKRMNHKPRYLTVDNALIGSGDAFDITRGNA